MVRNAGGAEANMDSSEIESSGTMTSSDDVMKLNGDVKMRMHNDAAAAVADRDVTATAGHGATGWAPTAMNGTL